MLKYLEVKCHDTCHLLKKKIMRETRDESLGREDLLEKEVATHSNILAWRIP